MSLLLPRSRSSWLLVRQSSPLRACAAAAIALAASAPASAFAGSFLPDGSFVFDPNAVVTIDFEDHTEPGATGVADPNALSGSHVLALTPMGGVDLPIKLPKSRATYRVSLWVDKAEVVGDLELSYTGHTDEVSALYPTGRVTSDGWVEVANDHLRVDGANLKKASVGLFSIGSAKIDAVEITPDGDTNALPPVPNAACGGVAEPTVCATGQLCIWSLCRNVNGWVPPIPADRDDVSAYLTARMQLLFGPFLERSQDLPASLSYAAAMSSANDPYTYWNAFTTAVRRLHDGHTSTQGLFDFAVANPRPFSFCTIEGDADLSHGVAPKDAEYLDVLISHVGADHNLGLNPGDRIVSIDGQHPIAWARSMIRASWSWVPTSNHSTYAELASSLRSLISRFAGEMQVIRCDATSGTCGAIETISITDVPLEDDPMGDFVTCDNRPIRHVPGAPADHATSDTAVWAGIVNESQPNEDIYGMEWESLDTTTGFDGVGPALNMAVQSWQSGARGVIMDHRTGYGGTIAGPEILWNFSSKTHPDDAYRDRVFAEEEQPKAADAIAYFNASLADGVALTCGTSDPNTTIPTALLITQDVSASDWLPQGFKGNGARIFGPFQTNGGFSTRYVFGYWLSLGYVLAVGDDILPDGTTHNGHGVLPDVVVLPKQSDLMSGQDTVFNAAITWIRQELAQGTGGAGGGAQ